MICDCGYEPMKVQVAWWHPVSTETSSRANTVNVFPTGAIVISKKHKSATLGAFTVLLVCGSYVCLLTILQSSFANRVPVAQFECGDGITLRIVADTVWSS